jgi:hypothetical protein
MPAGFVRPSVTFYLTYQTDKAPILLAENGFLWKSAYMGSFLNLGSELRA